MQLLPCDPQLVGKGQGWEASSSRSTDLTVLNLFLRSSGVSGLWQVPQVAPVAVLSGTP